MFSDFKIKGDYRRHWRDSIKLALNPNKAINSAPILLASIGRSGSTLVYEALIRARCRSIFWRYSRNKRHKIMSEIWDLCRRPLAPYTICKTHDFPYNLPNQAPLKIIFIYGRPSDTVLSLIRHMRVMGPEWMAKHFNHMHADGHFENLLYRDVLRLQEQIDAWFAVRNTSLLCIRYETLWNNLDALNKFLGFAVKLPARRIREYDDLPSATVSLARQTYRTLDEKVATLPDVWLVKRLTDGDH